MIAAITTSGIPVEVEHAACWVAQIRSLGRENISQSYVGGKGYVSTKFKNVDRSALEFVVRIDPETCNELKNWQDAMTESDEIADNDWPDVAAALKLEDDARRAFVEYVHNHSLDRSKGTNEITPEYARNPAINLVEVRIEELSTPGMALHSSGCQG